MIDDESCSDNFDRARATACAGAPRMQPSPCGARKEKNDSIVYYTIILMFIVYHIVSYYTILHNILYTIY